MSSTRPNPITPIASLLPVVVLNKFGFGPIELLFLLVFPDSSTLFLVTNDTSLPVFARLPGSKVPGSGDNGSEQEQLLIAINPPSRKDRKV